MTTRQIFIWGTIDGRPFTPIEDWIATLPENQQKEYHLSRENQSALRQLAIDNGDMYMDDNGDYVWRDETAAKKGKGIDIVWEKYWLRWKDECGITFQTEFIEE